MAQSNKITVAVYTNDGQQLPLFKDVNYISFVSSPGGQGEGTWGIPAIISEQRYKDEGLPLSVLYINPSNVSAVKATRTE